MGMHVEALDATLGAMVTGVRLAELDDVTWAEIEAAFHEHAVLVFPAQHLTVEQQVALARRFGAIEDILANGGLAPISNQRRDGSLRDRDDPVMHILLGNEGWHTDSSYMPVSAKASMLSARIVPSTGGETEWADMRAAYDALDPDRRALVDGLSAYHSIRYSQERAGFGDLSTGGYGYDQLDPPLRPLVKRHPVTGRPALFIGRHAHLIPGLEPADSERLLDELLDAAVRPPRTYRHRWQPGDLVVWDNRCVLHRACPYDLTEPRVMHHTRIAGDPATEGAERLGYATAR